MARWTLVALLALLYAVVAALLDGAMNRHVAVFVAFPILVAAGLVMESEIERRRRRRSLR